MPPIFIDRAGAKVGLIEQHSRSSKASLNLVLEQVRMQHCPTQIQSPLSHFSHHCLTHLLLLATMPLMHRAVNYVSQSCIHTFDCGVPAYVLGAPAHRCRLLIASMTLPPTSPNPESLTPRAGDGARRLGAGVLARDAAAADRHAGRGRAAHHAQRARR